MIVHICTRFVSYKAVDLKRNKFGYPGLYRPGFFVPICGAVVYLTMLDIPITNEQEAAVAVLFACVLNGNKTMSQSQIEQLSRMLVLSSKFRGASLNELTVKALSLQAERGSKLLIEHSAPLISDEFRETLFAMCCEVMTAEGKIDESESEILAMAALYLGLSVENMKMMLTTYLIRNRWNVQIIEQE